MKPETKNRPKDFSDLDTFMPAAPNKRLDDKAAQLEEEIQTLKVTFNREKYLYIFVMTIMSLVLVGSSAPDKVFNVCIVAALVFLIGVGKYLDFPWIVVPLEKWHDLIFRTVRRKFLNEKDDVEEPQDK